VSPTQVGYKAVTGTASPCPSFVAQSGRCGSEGFYLLAVFPGGVPGGLGLSRQGAKPPKRRRLCLCVVVPKSCGWR
jgi:hypothetical protein